MDGGLCMYYLWVAFRNRGKGFYLPKVENWSGRIYLSPRDTGLSDGCHIPVLANDGVWTIQPPDTFDWKDAGDEKRILEENKAYTLTNRDFEIVVRAALYSREIYLAAERHHHHRKGFGLYHCVSESAGFGPPSDTAPAERAQLHASGDKQQRHLHQQDAGEAQ